MVSCFSTSEKFKHAPIPKGERESENDSLGRQVTFGSTVPVFCFTNTSGSKVRDASALELQILLVEVYKYFKLGITNTLLVMMIAWEGR